MTTGNRPRGVLGRMSVVRAVNKGHVRVEVWLLEGGILRMELTQVASEVAPEVVLWAGEVCGDRAGADPRVNGRDAGGKPVAENTA